MPNAASNDIHTDSPEAGWLIRLHMAALLATKGKKEEAARHLIRALELDMANRIEKGNFLEGLELGEVYRAARQRDPNALQDPGNR